MADNAPHVQLVAAAAQALKDRKEEVNRLNVFPVPDGDTGTNMSLTMDSVVAELRELADAPTLSAVCHAITQGSLMGARGNSGVILSQILRGLCDVIATAETFDTDLVARALGRAKDVAFQAVRKPVEGTMLTVLKDAAAEAAAAHERGDELDDALARVVHASFESVRRTPELLPVLKENNVVDAGGFGVAILAEGLLAAYQGHEVQVEDVSLDAAPSFAVVPEDDWDDEEYLYCTEFLLYGTDLDRDVVHDYVSGQGGSELVVGEGDLLKIHVHTDDPGSVLAYMTGIGEVAEVHINNMRRQTAERSRELQESSTTAEPEPYSIVTVAVGSGIESILKSLGANVIVNGGQTMNPSTAEILEAAATVNAESVIVLPNNKNILLAAQQAAEVASRPVGVVPTTSIPEAFAALLVFDPDASLEHNVEAMTEARSEVRTGEITTAIKDSKGKVGAIRAGQIIGIANHEIEVVGEDLCDVAVELLDHLLEDGETVTLLAGEEMSDEQLNDLAQRIETAHPDVAVEPHRGDQPLYPIIMSVE